MKRNILLTTLIIALAITAACDGQSPIAPGFEAEDLYLSFDGADYGLNANIETVTAALGLDYEYSEAISCDYDGLDKTYFYDMMEFYTYPLPEGDLVNEIYTESPDVLTSKGIRVGASEKDITAAYGENYEDTGYQIIYKLPGAAGTIDGGALCFDMENGKAKAIYITTRPL